MRTQSSDNGCNDQQGATIALSVPIRDESLFNHQASAPILQFLGDNPEFDLSVRQLSRVTPVSARATGDAVDALAANGLVEVAHEGNARRVRINRNRFWDPDDPIKRVPQPRYHIPIRVAQHYLQDELDGVCGLVLFGSAARGEADRQSDIDLWVLVEGDSTHLLEQRNGANKLARTLETLRIPSSVAMLEEQGRDFRSQWPSIRERLEDDDSWASAPRYAYEFVVETRESFLGQSDRVDPHQLFAEGITIESSPTLDDVKSEVVSDD